MNVHQAPRSAEKPTTSAHTTHKRTASAEEMSHSVGQGYLAATEAVRDFNMKLIEMAQANTMATFNFAQQVATAKGPSEVASLWTSYARERFETLTGQTRKLTTLAQSVMISTAGPLTNGLARNAAREHLSGERTSS
jgi:hypothetical protein